MSYKKYKWEKLAQDNGSPFFRNYLWTDCFKLYPRLFKAKRLIVAIASQRNAIEYLTDFKYWSRSHEEFKNKAIKDTDFVRKIIDFTVRHGVEMNRFTERNIFKKDLRQLSGSALCRLYGQFIKKQALQYAYGVALPVLDFQGYSLVENFLKDYLNKHASVKEYPEYYSIFTSPARSSFAMEQEEKLLALMAKFHNNLSWRKSVLTKAWPEICHQFPLFSRLLSRHARKYAWVYYVYNGPEYGAGEYYDFIRDYLKKGVHPLKKLTEIKSIRREILAKKKKYLARLKPDNFEKKMINLASLLVWAKPRRKDYQSRSYYHAQKLLKEIAKRLSLTLDQVKSAPFPWLEKALKGQSEIDVKSINEIYKFHICLPADENKTLILYGKKAEIFARKYGKRAKAGFSGKKTNVITGECACAGYARGRVKIVNSREQMSKVNYGDILVSVATSPNLMPAMKKAAAFVTEEGGLTSHAAIVSREMNVPCVIGTKIATQVLMDGDKVEVNATKGIIRKL